MKAANFVNVLLAIALVILCAELHAERKAREKMAASLLRAEGAGSQSHAEGAEAKFHAEGAEAKFHAEGAEGAAEGAKETAARHAEPIVIDSTDLAPGVSGFGGPVPVLVEVKDGVVAGVSPKLPNDETPGFFKRLDEAGLWKAWDGLPVGVAATTRVDAVASATYSSEAAIANVRAALEAAAKAEK